MACSIARTFTAGGWQRWPRPHGRSGWVMAATTVAPSKATRCRNTVAANGGVPKKAIRRRCALSA
ncbi:hypothetical protein TDMWS_04330 [Thermodesulfomicrobium sp. WS]|nr:hypothetical protein TDMWS_04330 [Thermodesulfomicrobium sp. WS]